MSSALKRVLCVGPTRLTPVERVQLRTWMTPVYPDGLPGELAAAIDGGHRDTIVDVLYAIDDTRGGDKSFEWVPLMARGVLNREWVGKVIAGYGLRLLYAGTNRCDCCAGWRVIAGVVALVSQAVVIFWRW